ncbi:hypothetical protein SK128_007600 [Halocaridina rubra]|uniref:Uncharacterized protein n=1 Tax=Halocaridina rubra TaxID=373956 RepID=A0AAN8WBN5_HALRR
MLGGKKHKYTSIFFSGGRFTEAYSRCFNSISADMKITTAALFFLLGLIFILSGTTEAARPNNLAKMMREGKINGHDRMPQRGGEHDCEPDDCEDSLCPGTCRCACFWFESTQGRCGGNRNCRCCVGNLRFPGN